MHIYLVVVAIALTGCTSPSHSKGVGDQLSSTDAIVFRSLLPPIDGISDEFTQTDPAVIRGLLVILRDVARQAERTSHSQPRNADAFPCQCFGEFELRLLSRSRGIASVSFHHWQHVRSPELTAGADVQIPQSAMAHVYQLAIAALPGHARQLNRPNKAPEPTPTAVTSPADAGAAPAAGVAHL